MTRLYQPIQECNWCTRWATKQYGSYHACNFHWKEAANKEKFYPIYSAARPAL